MNLQGNKISRLTIESNWPILSSLKYLNLSHNQIRGDLPPMFHLLGMFFFFFTPTPFSEILQVFFFFLVTGGSWKKDYLYRFSIGF